MDKLTAIRAFVRVSDSGTFSKAADLMDIPKPTVTRLVQMLENDMNVKLLHRTTRHVRMTPEGAAYYEGAVRLLAELEELEAGVSKASIRPRGRVRFELPTSLAYSVVIPALPEFLTQYPEIQVEVGISNRAVDLVAENLDFVVRLGPVFNESLVTRPLCELPVRVSASPKYLARHGRPKHPNNLKEGHSLIRVVSPTTGRPFRREFRKGDERIAIGDNSPISVNDSGAAVAAGLAGLGVVTTFAHLVDSHIASGALVEILPGWTSGAAQVQVAYPPNRYISKKVRVLIDWLVVLFAGRFGRPGRKRDLTTRTIKTGARG
jgi:LysR family transcriptional regulator, regulator for bpeEF and oprC